MSARKLEIGEPVIWSQQRKWGGKQNMPATYLGSRGVFSCRIRLGNGEERTVRSENVRGDSLAPEAEKEQ